LSFFCRGVLGIGIIRLSGLSPDIGLTMVSTMSFRALTDAFHGLMMKHVAGHDQHKRRYLDIMKAIRGFEQFRNQVSHSLWQTNVSDPQQTIRVKARTTRQGFDEVMEIVTIEKISAEIVKAQTALTDLEILVAEILMPAAGES
jgi:hypothetical protein